MRIRLSAAAAVAVALLTFTPAASAQSVGKMLGDDFKNLGKDVVSVWASPLDASGRDWLLVVGALGAFGASMLADQELSDWAIEHDSSAFFKAIKPVRRGGYLFSGKYVLPPVAAVYIFGLATRNEDARDFLMGCMSSWIAQGATRRVLAYSFGRARPDTMPNDPQHWELGGGWGNWQMRSFPAGHFANILGCATYWNKRFRLGAAGPVVYALAGMVGVGRMADRAHWFSDTVIGGILGYAVGSEVARRTNARRAGASPSSATSLYITPDANGAVNAGMRWSF